MLARQIHPFVLFCWWPSEPTGMGRLGSRSLWLLNFSSLAARIGRHWQAPPPAFKRAGKTNPLTKPSLQEVFDKLGKGEVCPAMRQQLFHLKNFLQVLQVPCTSLKKRLAAFHQMLMQAGVPSKFRQVKSPGTPGRPPWMGTKTMYRALYDSF